MSTEPETEALASFTVEPYDPAWAEWYAEEAQALWSLLGAVLLHLEHIGSTAVPGLDAKPIIDMMASVRSVADMEIFPQALDALGYRVVPVQMSNRIMLRRRSTADGRIFHLHVVEEASWGTRKERIMRDYLRCHPDVAEAYGVLKKKLAAECAGDSLAYTRRKTEFIQALMDDAHRELGMPLVDVWEE